MKLTAIKAQVKNQDRVSLYVDGKYAFSLTQNQLLEEKLRVGLELDEARLATLKRASDFGKLQERLLRYVTLRPRSQKEVLDYCKRKQFPLEDCQAIIDKFVERRYIDDEHFARAWVESRRLNKPSSKRRLQQELQQKGVAHSVIEAALNQQGAYDERQALRTLIIKKRRQARYQDDQRLLQYLLRQGFRYGEIIQFLQTPTLDEDD